MKMPKPDSIPPKRKPGRPKGAVGQRAEARRMTVREYAMTHVFDAIDVWAQVMNNKEEGGAARSAAAAHIVNRAIGQPAQASATENDTPDQTLQRIERVVIDVPVPAKRKQPA